MIDGICDIAQSLLPLPESLFRCLVDLWQVVVIVGVLGLPRGLFFPGLGLLLLGHALALATGSGSGRGVARQSRGRRQSRILAHPGNVEGDEVPHHVCLKQTDGDKSDDPECESVVSPCGDVDHLVGGEGEAVPEGEDGGGDGAQADQDEQGLVDVVEGLSHRTLVGVGKEAAGVEHGLGSVVQDHQAQSDPVVVEDVGSHDEGQVE